MDSLPSGAGGVPPPSGGSASPQVLSMDPTFVVAEVRQPHPTMMVNGVPTKGLLKFSVYSNGFLSADTWSAEVALTGAAAPFGPAFWAGQDDLELDLGIALGKGPSSRIILGRADRVQLDFATQLVRLSGRDYTGLLVDKKTSEKFRNLTASAIVTELATRVGLSTNVEATSTIIGQYYDAEHVVINGAQTSEQSYWTLMTYCAQHEGMNLWVSGKTVFMQPPTDPGTNPVQIAYKYPKPNIPRSNETSIMLERGMTLVRDASVTVISWSHAEQKAVSATATSQKSPRVPTGGPKYNGSYLPTNQYRFNIPGLTKDQAQQEATKRLADITKHERRVTVEGTPGDLTTTPRSWLKLTGTGTDFDQTYLVERIQRSIGWDEGFKMSIWGKNSSPATSVTL